LYPAHQPHGVHIPDSRVLNWLAHGGLVYRFTAG
jgi:hypothetical protein